ncbi:MAG: carnitine 3-dehydrogenase [Woeseiaceae bacterium]|nr:carnitine 3-dehydrogenase [Woeseiaceae bacterium]
MSSNTKQRAAIIGGGVIGGGWAARFLLQGWDVSVYDPHPAARESMDLILGNARLSLPALSDFPMPPEGQLTFVDSIKDAVSNATWVQESVPETLDLKHRVIAEIEADAAADTIIGSSTSGFKPSQLQVGARHPGRIVVAHPFNPVYLLPLVEVVPSPVVNDETRERAVELLTSIGMKPLVVRKEIDAHIADRFLEATWREALWLVKDDIATTEEIDDAIRYGFGLRWAQMGLFETYRLAGGEAGMAHFIAQFGPCLQWPWTKLTDVPELTDELVEKIASQSDAQSGAHSIRELERIRDRNLVGILRALKDRDSGAGAVLNLHDQNRSTTESAPLPAEPDASGPLRMLDVSVLPAWIDYNGHMTEFRYVQVFSDTCDRLLIMIGMDADYVAAGCSYYTAETHTMQVDEIGVNQRIYSTAQVLAADKKRIHVFYCLHAADDDRLLATTEAMYLHVNRESGRVCTASDRIVDNIQSIANAHAALSKPEAVGRFVGQRKKDKK